MTEPTAQPQPVPPANKKPAGSWLGAVALGVLALLIAARLGWTLFSGQAPLSPSPAAWLGWPMTFTPTPPPSGEGETIALTPTPLPLGEGNAATQPPLPVGEGGGEGESTPTDAPTDAPTRTPIPTPTVVPLRLAVESGVYTLYQTFFDSLAARHEGLTALPYPRNAAIDDALAMQTSDAVIHWAVEPPDDRAVLLREEPFIVAAHPLFPKDALTLAQLGAMANGQDQTYTMVVAAEGDGAAIIRGLLGLEALAEGAISATTWVEAKEYVATHKGAWAILPWEAVDFRVKALAVEGLHWSPTAEPGYPLQRRLWLRDRAHLPADLVDDLDGALYYALPPTAELVAVGDVMLSRLVGERIVEFGARYPFEAEGLQPLLAKADIAFGNLECPVSDRGDKQDKGYEFRADPMVMEGLTWAGFDVLSLANNHTGDYADLALTDTLKLLTDAKIVTVGAGHNITEAHEARVVTANGLRVAFLAYNQIGPDWFAATATSPGSAFFDATRMATDVQAARQKADLVVVSCHWGVEYTPYPNASQQKLAKQLTEAGAALILGHHPHVVQGVGYERKALITYSLGNFVFDQGGEETSQGVILRCILDTSGVKTWQLLPVWIDKNQPTLLDAEKGRPILDRIWKVTQEQNALPK